MWAISYVWVVIVEALLLTILPQHIRGGMEQANQIRRKDLALSILTLRRWQSEAR